MRECGLKPIRFLYEDTDLKSLPMRECGLKPKIRADHISIAAVTPHAGVWIETSHRR